MGRRSRPPLPRYKALVVSDDTDSNPEPESVRPPERVRLAAHQVSIVPDIHRLMSDAMVVAGSELEHLVAESKARRGMTEEQSRRFHRVVRAAESLAKMERDARRDGDFGELTDEQLLELLPQAMEALQGDTEDDAEDD